MLRFNIINIPNPNSTPRVQHLTMNSATALMASHNIVNPNSTPRAQHLTMNSASALMTSHNTINIPNPNSIFDCQRSVQKRELLDWQQKAAESSICQHLEIHLLLELLDWQQKAVESSVDMLGVHCAPSSGELLAVLSADELERFCFAGNY
jgi:hypothetical protein